MPAARSFFHEMPERFGAADPKARVKRASPDMSVRSSITARLMETWAHGQAVYGVLGETATRWMSIAQCLAGQPVREALTQPRAGAQAARRPNRS